MFLCRPSPVRSIAVWDPLSLKELFRYRPTLRKPPQFVAPIASWAVPPGSFVVGGKDSKVFNF